MLRTIRRSTMAAWRRGDLPSAALVEDSTLEKTPYHRDIAYDRSDVNVPAYRTYDESKGVFHSNSRYQSAMTLRAFAAPLAAFRTSVTKERYGTHLRKFNVHECTSAAGVGIDNTEACHTLAESMR